jgi:hypothetical protein
VRTLFALSVFGPLRGVQLVAELGDTFLDARAATAQRTAGLLAFPLADDRLAESPSALPSAMSR